MQNLSESIGHILGRGGGRGTGATRTQAFVASVCVYGVSDSLLWLFWLTHAPGIFKVSLRNVQNIIGAIKSVQDGRSGKWKHN